MNEFTIGDVVRVAGGALCSRQPEQATALCPTGVSIDSRTIQEGNIFFALHGERFDGHDFIGQALANGALAVVVAHQWVGQHAAQHEAVSLSILCDDTLRAFQECAKYYRSLFPIPVVAVTGTNGKTTTKNMISAVLSGSYNCLCTEGSLNNHIGLPLTLFQLKADQQVAVVELAMRAPGEIARLAEICRPQFGLITNVGPAHVQFFGSVQEIARAKGELLDHLGPQGTAILNADDPLVMGQRQRMKGKVVTFGLECTADVRAEVVRSTPDGRVMFQMEEGVIIQLRTPGRHMVRNALGAIALGRQFNVSIEDMKEALESLQSGPMRMEMIDLDGLRIVNDAYNANPVSMRAALEALDEMDVPGRKMAVLGDMLELGERAVPSHREIGRQIAAMKIEHLLTFGQLSRLIGDEAISSGMMAQNVHHFVDKEDLGRFLEETAEDGDLILVKGSRKMGLEEIVNRLEKRRQNPMPTVGRR